MKRFEHLVVFVEKDYDREYNSTTIKEISISADDEFITIERLGNEGWEMTAMYRHAGQEDWLYWFKRELPPEGVKAGVLEI